MTNQDVVLNIAVNLGRLGKWAHEGKTDRIPQFLKDTQGYVDQLAQAGEDFRSTQQQFLTAYQYLKTTVPNPDRWAETAFTWANILSHRAKFA